ncbi:ABC transporter substrate-binding protein [Atrimonas thermophila]|uniref:ABC transporter substrate-binding protein n=1 Tax=Atrimonas thermophila TaxID=3064161 RepID=UPI00399D13AE
MYKRLKIFTVFFALSVLLFANIASGLSVTDDRGQQVELAQPPARIVSLAPSCTEMLFALSLSQKIVGVTTYCNFPQEALSKEKVGTITEVELEKLLSLQPDLVVASSLNPQELLTRLEELGITVYLVNPQNIEEILSDLEKLAKICGVEEKGETLVHSLRERIKRVEEKTAGMPEAQKPLVFHLIWHQPIWTAGKGTFIDELIEKAGGKNAASDLEGYVSIELEELLRRNPDIITVVENHGDAQNLPYQFLLQDQRLQTLKAVKERRVARVDSDIVSRPGPRIVQALEIFAKIIHPEIFGEYRFEDYETQTATRSN